LGSSRFGPPLCGAAERPEALGAGRSLADQWLSSDEDADGAIG